MTFDTQKLVFIAIGHILSILTSNHIFVFQWKNSISSEENKNSQLILSYECQP